MPLNLYVRNANEISVGQKISKLWMLLGVSVAHVYNISLVIRILITMNTIWLMGFHVDQKILIAHVNTLVNQILISMKIIWVCS